LANEWPTNFVGQFGKLPLDKLATCPTSLSKPMLFEAHLKRIRKAIVVLKTGHLKGGGFNPIYRQ
jgi:hypothetical protein